MKKRARRAKAKEEDVELSGGYDAVLQEPLLTERMMHYECEVRCCDLAEYKLLREAEESQKRYRAELVALRARKQEHEATYHATIKAIEAKHGIVMREWVYCPDSNALCRLPEGMR